jgi:cyclophilin family peptidyl-prolyl cis-trans isomerase
MSLLSRHSAGVRVAPIENLESRTLLHNVLLAPVADMTIGNGDPAQTVDLTQHIDYEDADGTVVNLATNFGNIPVGLTDGATPGTVENFLRYVNENRYDNTIFHRLATGFVLQGGGFTPAKASVPSFGAIPNEYSDARPNVAGTIAMAKLGGDPNSATSQFFINLADNTNILNSSQNGGFTTFGQVLDMTAVNAIAALGTVDEGGAFGELPKASDGTVPTITDASVVPENTFAVTSSKAGVVNATVTGGQLSIVPVAVGSTDLTVTATAVDGSTLAETFAVNVAGTEATIVLGPGADQSRQVVFVDADGTRTTISSTNSTSTVLFSGTNLTESTSNRVTTISGDNVAMTSISVAGVTRVTSALNIVASGGDGFVNVPDVNVDGTLGTLNATRGILTGDVTTTGGLGRVNVAQINGGSLTTQTAGLALQLNATSLSDADINTAGAIRSATVRGAVTGGTWNSAGPISKLTVGSWTNAAGDSSLTASSIGTLTSTGDFGPDVTASGGLSRFSSRATVTGGTWNIGAGPAATVAAQNTADGWIGAFSGAVRSVAVRGTLDGTLAAGSIGTLTAGTLSGPVSLSDAAAPLSLGTLNVTNLTDAEVRAASSIRSINVRGGSVRSGIYVGIAGGETDVLGAADFVNPAASIATARFNAPRGTAAFSDSAIIAPSLGNITLGAVSDAPGTLPFVGTASDALRQLNFTVGAQRVRLTDASPIADQLTAQGVTLTNVDVVVL